MLVHARALLNPVPGSTGSLSYLDADLSDPAAVLAAPQITDTLDLSRPVAVTMIAVLQLFHDDDQARALIDHYVGRLAPGSFLAISTVTTDNDPDTVKRVVGAANRHGFPLRHRTRDEVAALFGDLELVEPGVVAVHRWHPDDHEETINDKEIGMYGGVARKS